MQNFKLAIVALALIGQPVLAQSEGVMDSLATENLIADSIGNRWTLQDCINSAIENNLTIKKAMLSKDEMLISYQRVLNQRLPNLSMSLSDRVAYGTSIDPITSDFISQTNNSASGGLNSSVTLYAGSTLSNQIARTRLQVEQNCIYIEEAKKDINLSIAEAYIQALYSRENIEACRNSYEVSVMELERERIRFEAGSIAAAVVVATESQVASNRYRLQEAEISYNQQLLTLKQLLELPLEENLEVVAIDTSYVSDWIIPNKVEIFRIARGIEPGIKAQELQLDIDEKSLEIARGAYMPTLSLSGGVSTGFTNSRDGSFGDQLHGNLSSNIGLSLSIPIFNRYQTKTSVMSAKLGIERSEIALTEAEKELQRKVEQVWFSATSAQNQMVSAQKSVESMQKANEQIEAQYLAGMVNRLDLTQSRDNLLNAEQSYLQAKYMTMLYKILIAFYTGDSLGLPQ